MFFPHLATPVRLTSSGLVYNGHCYLASVLVGTDGVNDPAIGVYNDINGDTEAQRVVPSVTYDAELLGLNGVVYNFLIDCCVGIYVSISNLGSGEVIVSYRTLPR